MGTLAQRIKVKFNAAWARRTNFDRNGITEVGSSNGVNRDEWIIDCLDKLSLGIRLLDAGAGEKPYKKYCQHLQYVSQDFAQYDPKAVETGLQMEIWDYGKLDIVSDITAIPEPDASFDAILCTEVIEHIVNPVEAIKEFSRLLKPGGCLLLTAPFCSLTHFAPYHFYSGFTRFFYQEALIKNGFDIIEMTENGNYFEYMAQELKRLNYVGNRYAGTDQNEEVKQSINYLLQYLYKCSMKDKASQEILYFGMHVKAIKPGASNP